MHSVSFGHLHFPAVLIKSAWGDSANPLRLSQSVAASSCTKQLVQCSKTKCCLSCWSTILHKRYLWWREDIALLAIHTVILKCLLSGITKTSFFLFKKISPIFEVFENRLIWSYIVVACWGSTVFVWLRDMGSCSLAVPRSEERGCTA